MALWLQSSAASVAAGGTVITCTDSTDFSSVKAGDIVMIAGQLWQALKGTAPDPSGVSALHLASPWPWSGANGASAYVIRTTHELLRLATEIPSLTQITKELLAKFEDVLTSDQASIEVPVGTDPITGAPRTIPVTPWQYVLDSISGAVGDHINLAAAPAAVWHAQAAQRRATAAGSGFLEWGRHYRKVGTITPVNQGMWCFVQTPLENIIQLGCDNAQEGEGVSRTGDPTVLVAGAAITIRHTNVAASADQRNRLKLPPAPDGLDKADGSGRFADLSAAIAAGGTELSQSVIHRQDLVLLEVWHEKVATKGVVLPLGNAQFGAANYDGIPTKPITSLGVTQGYSAFGTWDTATIGAGWNWSALSAEQKRIVLANPAHNLYVEGGELIQVRYRFRSLAGLNGEWAIPVPHNIPESGNGVLRFGNATAVFTQGASMTARDFTNNWGEGYSRTRHQGATSLGFSDPGAAYALGRFSGAHKDLCFAVPIALVRRYNKGGYHPTINPMGVRHLKSTTADGGAPWYMVDYLPTVAQCFTTRAYGNNQAGAYAHSGSIADGISTHPAGLFYDAIYEHMITDLRMSALVRPRSEILAEATQKALGGTLRGMDYQPVIITINITDVSGSGSSLLFRADMSSGDPSPPSALPVPGNNYPWPYKSTSRNVAQYMLHNLTLGESRGAHAENSYGWLSPLTIPGLASGDFRNWKVGHRIMVLPLCPGYGPRLPAPFSGVALPWQDVMGDPARIAATFPGGVWGQWVPAIPDGLTAPWNNFKASRKSLSGGVLQKVQSDDDGGSWVSGSHSFDSVVNAPSAATYPPATRVELWFYTTPSHPTVKASNLPRVAKGDVTLTAASSEALGAVMHSSLSGFVPVTTTSAYQPKRAPVIDELDQSLASLDSRHWPIHMAPDWRGFSANNNGQVCKWLTSLVVINDVMLTQYHGRSMIWGGADWGDNNMIPIGDGDYAMTDDNGHACRAFCHQSALPLPYFYAEHQEAQA